MVVSSGTRLISSLLVYLLAVSLSVSAGHSHQAKAACDALKHLLGTSKVQTVGGPGYEASARGAWDYYNQLDGSPIFHTPLEPYLDGHFIFICSLSDPSCIVFPRNSSDVVVAMRTIFLSDAHYAVRGGGHSAMPQWNT